MHKFRRQARNLAWYDQEGEPESHNPFKKIRPRKTHSAESQAEIGLSRFRSEGDAILTAESSRRRDLDGILEDPERSNTMPPNSSGNGKGKEDSLETDRAPESTMSTTPINVSKEQDEPVHNHPRKRKFLGALARKSEDDTDQDRESIRSSKRKPHFTAMGQFRATILNSWINILLIAVPVGIIINYLHLNPIAIFVVNFIAIVPLAAMLSYATEEIAMRTGETLGGLLNATFGNAVELIVSILALVKDEVVIVQTSLIGSMLSNLLLVMGMCFFFGGLNRVEQNFNVTVAQTASSLLALAVGSLIIPTVFVKWSDSADAAAEAQIAPISRGTSIILLVVYGCYLFFQLMSHADMYNAPSPKNEKRKQKVEQGDAIKGLAQVGAGMSASVGGQNVQQNPVIEVEDEEEPQLSMPVALLTLTLSTVLVALCAEFMVDSISALTETGNISEVFVGLILLPIVGNAAEHATAVTVAVKDKMDLAIGVAVGSSMQIALLVLPLIVVIGWIMGKDDMNLEFDGFQIAVLFVTVLLVNYLIQDGKSHWLEGVLLMTLYLIIAVSAWFYP